MSLRTPNLRRTCCPGSRRALTLLEMMLVLALLVVMAALSVPLFRGSLARGKLVSGGEQVRAAWAAGRVLAMKSGRTHLFVYEIGGRRYHLEVVVEADDALESSTAAASQDAALSGAATALSPPVSAGSGSGAVAGNVATVREEDLPEGIVFGDEMGQLSGPGLAPAPAAGATSGNWSSPIFFYPDGTTSNAQLLVADATGQAVAIQLRGLTGLSRQSEPVRLAEAMP